VFQFQPAIQFSSMYITTFQPDETLENIQNYLQNKIHNLVYNFLFTTNLFMKLNNSQLFLTMKDETKSHGSS